MLGALPFCAIGLFIGVRVRAKSAPAFVNLVYLPSMFLAQMFFPLPESIRGFRFLSPLYYLRTIAYDAAGITAHDGMAMLVHAGVLAGLTVLLVATSVRRLARVG